MCCGLSRYRLSKSGHHRIGAERLEIGQSGARRAGGPVVSERRVAGVAGVVFGVTSVLQFVVAPSPPNWDASGAEIRRWFDDHRSGVLVQGWLMLVSVLAFVVFVVGVCDMLRRGARGR